MKTGIRNLFLLSLLPAALGLMLAGRVTAQTFTTLHTFTALDQSYGTNSDGVNPVGLILSGNILYGTASSGGSGRFGTVFALNTDGTGFTNLHNFTEVSDGAQPGAGLILSGNTLYGTAHSGGSSFMGTVFALNIDGTGFTNLHSFTATSTGNQEGTNTDGADPNALTLSGNTLYGTAWGGGSWGNGTIFKMNTDGTEFTTLYSFTAGATGINSSGLNAYTNSGGAAPQAGLVLSGDTLYGTANYGGSSGSGTVFAIKTNGTGFTTLHNFTAGSGTYTNRDGAYPVAGLILSGSILYGTATTSGSSGNGTVFALNTDGTGFTNLHSFTATAYGTNSDGAYPVTELILSGSTLYGTARTGGNGGNGTIFNISTDGTGFANLHNFTMSLSNSGGPYSPVTNSDGAFPLRGLVFSGNTLYGTANGGGDSANGTIFSLFIQPQLTITSAGASVILTWPTNYTDFTLQSTTNLASPVWTTNLPTAVVVGRLNTVTNLITGTRQFYRLSR